MRTIAKEDMLEALWALLGGALAVAFASTVAWSLLGFFLV
jgi:hypothetical protein